jgi:hypothetical protein
MTRAVKFMISLAVIFFCAYAALCGYLYVKQRSLLYFPQPRFNAAVPVMHFQRGGADLLVSVRPHESEHAVLYFGGNAEDVSQALPSLAAAFPDAAIYALHYRGYGGSAGEPTEIDLVADGAALFDLVQVKHRSVTVIGRSLGSGVAIQVAASRPVSRLVLVTPYSSIAEVAALNFWYVPVNWLLKDRYDSWKFAPQISAPTTVIAAEHDDIIPMSGTRQLFNRFKPGTANFIVIDDAGHNDISEKSAYIPALRGGRA